MTDTLYAAGALASALAAVLAWLAKLKWSREYGLAKDEVIRAKDAQIELLKEEVEGLREMTPMKIREYFVSVKQQLEEYNDTLKQSLNAAQGEIQPRDQIIVSLRAAGDQSSAALQAIERERDELREAARRLEEQLPVTLEFADLVLTRYQMSDAKPKAADQIFKVLRNSLVHNQDPVKIAEVQTILDREEVARENLNRLLSGSVYDVKEWHSKYLPTDQPRKDEPPSNPDGA